MDSEHNVLSPNCPCVQCSANIAPRLPCFRAAIWRLLIIITASSSSDHYDCCDHYHVLHVGRGRDGEPVELETNLREDVTLSLLDTTIRGLNFS